MDKEKKRTIQYFIIFTAVVTLAVIHFRSLAAWAAYGWNVMIPFFIGGAIAFVLNIPMSGIEKKLFGNAKGKLRTFVRPLCILITYFIFIAALLLICLTIIPRISTAIREQELAERIPKFLDQIWIQLRQWAQQYPVLQEQLAELQQTEIDWEKLFQSIIDFLSNGVGSSVLESTVNIAGSIIGGIVNVLIAIVFSVYILASKETLARQFHKLLSVFVKKDTAARVVKVLRLLSDCFRRFITGQFTEAVILGCMFFVVLSIGRFPYALIISLLIGVMALIPIAGAFVGCFVGAFLILMENPIRAVWFVVLFLILQQIEGNLIYPKVVGNSVGLPSIWVLVAVTVGGSLFGVTGMLVFIPILSAVYALLKEKAEAAAPDQKKVKTPVPKRPDLKKR